jgi:hypothetical protein
VKIYVAAVKAKRKEGMKLNLPPKLVEKLVWVPVISFCKISFPVTHLMPYYAKTGRSRHALLCQNWPFLPPNRLTLRITLLDNEKYKYYIS